MGYPGHLEQVGRFTLWRRPVPYVTPEIVNAAVFLYRSAADAEAGVRWGGSGFLVGVQSGSYHAHLYAVSNDHVVHSFPVVRLMRRGNAEYVSGTGEWRSHPDGDDVAVLYLGRSPARTFAAIPIFRLLTQQDLTSKAIGPGDDCLMVGRFTRRSGQQVDRPVVRFGNIAMSPESVRQPERGFDQLSFLVDMRSASGFSGSAVVTYFGGGGFYGIDGYRGPDLSDPRVVPRDLLGDWWLLGVDWGHLPVTLDVTGDDGAIQGRAQVESGMAAVVPAWKLADLLDSEDAVKERQEAEDRAEAERSLEDAVLDVAEPSSLDQTADLLGKLMAVPKDEARPE